MTPQEFTDKFDNLPDGAFWALAEEHGLYPEDFIEAEEQDVKQDSKTDSD